MILYVYLPNYLWRKQGGRYCHHFISCYLQVNSERNKVFDCLFKAISVVGRNWVEIGRYLPTLMKPRLGGTCTYLLVYFMYDNH